MKKILVLSMMILALWACSSEAVDSKPHEAVFKKSSSSTIDLVLSIDTTRKVGHITSAGQIVLNSVVLPSQAEIGQVLYDLSDLSYMGSYEDHTLYITYLATNADGENVSFATSIRGVDPVPFGMGCPNHSHSCRGVNCSTCQFTTTPAGCILGCNCTGGIEDPGQLNSICEHSISSGSGGNPPIDLIDEMIQIIIESALPL